MDFTRRENESVRSIQGKDLFCLYITGTGRENRESEEKEAEF